MAKFMNVVRTTVKADCRDEFLKQHSEGLEFDGLASFSLIQTGIAMEKLLNPRGANAV